MTEQKPGPAGPAGRREDRPGDAATESKNSSAGSAPPRPKELGGPSGPEPTRYGDWERNGRCTDF